MNASIKHVVIGVISAGLAQILKIFFQRIKTGKWNMFAIFSSGQMPSSHTSGITAIATSIYLAEGTTTALSVAVGLLLIVMYDAISVRWYSGIAAQKISHLVEQLVENGVVKKHKLLEQKLKLVIGHTGAEVIVGFGFGILVAHLLIRIL